ncbi:glycoside hydrolase family 18 protein [Paenibacillus daejeonensis]|uniref:glycoside hydrolase family 18 protein n=1 Tax=Paenibacillus daejeonensis TaxID=135193 RepID=UPI00037DBE2C|nr:glycoside hydrolase family 18 protein [Paenibacillus daejeonensis]
MSSAYKVIGYIGAGDLPNVTQEALFKLTHINLAFGHIRDDQIVTHHLSNMGRIAELKRLHPGVTILLSVGGWSAGGFSEAAATEEGRRAMTRSALRVIDEHGLDGIDLDWEYPCYGVAGITASPEDRRNFSLLLRELREALDRKGAVDGRSYSLTIAAGADQYYIDGTEMAEVQRYLDYVQLMTYDMRGGFQTLTGHHTNLYAPTGDLFRISTDASVKLFERAGVPRDKLVIGAAFYSRMWKSVPNMQEGLHQMAGTSGGYGPNYAELAADYIGKNGYKRHWDQEAKAPFLFDGSTFISYDDEQSIAHKCDYIKREGLAGLMFWEYGCDRTGVLLEAISKGLQKMD